MRFELTVACTTTVFKTVPLNRSGTPPHRIYYTSSTHYGQFKTADAGIGFRIRRVSHLYIKPFLPCLFLCKYGVIKTVPRMNSQNAAEEETDLKYLTILVLLFVFMVTPLLAEDYIIRPGDNLGVTVLGEADLTRHVTVGPQGGITLPLVNEINVAGITTTQAAQMIAEQLKHFLKNPTVSVELLEPAKLNFTISGGIKNPGAYPITQGLTLREALMLAGGPTEIADLSNITLRREGLTDAIPIDYAKAVSGDKVADPELKPGDVIFIAVREQLGFYTIQGAIAAPGRYELKGNTTITEAIAIAGGAGGRARLSDVRILRASNGAARTLQTDISAIMMGKTENIPVQSGDSIFIPESRQKPDVMRILSFAVSIGWLLTRR